MWEHPKLCSTSYALSVLRTFGGTIFDVDDSHARDVVLHIGTHKTGTTSFQATLAASAASLASHGVHVFQSGLTVFQSGRTKSAGWSHELPLISLRSELNIPLRCMFPDSSLQSMQSQMLQDCISQMQSPARRVVASHEALSFIRTRKEVERLIEALDGRVCKVVCVLREAESFLQSWKNQLAKTGQATSSAHFESYMNTDPDSWIVDWEELIGAYAGVLGREAVTVLDYERETQNHGTIIHALWSACGLPESLRPNHSAEWLNSSH